MHCNHLLPGCVSKNVLVGHQGQLFLFEGSYNQFSFLSGNEQVAEASKFNFLNNLRHRQAFADRLNIPYLHVVVPCKPLVFRHQCPNPYRQTIRSLFLHAYAPLFKGNDPIEERVLYPLAALIRSQAHEDCYWANDTHINAIGQLCLYREIGKYLPGLSDNFPQFQITRQPRLGDLALMLGQSEPLPSLCFAWLGETLQYNNTNELPGNTGDVVIAFNPLSKTERRLVLFGDSFIKTMLHLFAQDFRTTLYIRGPYFQPDIIELFNPDVLITSETERYLAGVDSDENGSSLLFSTVTPTDHYSPTPEFLKALSAQLSHRSHPKFTQQWAHEQVIEHQFYIKGIGAAIHNRDIKQLDHATMQFEAIGPAPVIHVHYLDKPKQSHLLINLDSDVDSEFKLTILRPCLTMTAALEIYNYPIKAGNQTFHINTNQIDRIDGLLIQPLDKKGHFSINKIEWCK